MDEIKRQYDCVYSLLGSYKAKPIVTKIESTELSTQCSNLVAVLQRTATEHGFSEGKFPPEVSLEFVTEFIEINTDIKNLKRDVLAALQSNA
jgi:hypothetical protein